MSAPLLTTVTQILEQVKRHKKFVLFYFANATYKDENGIKTLKTFMQLTKSKGIPAAQCVISNLDNPDYLGSNHGIRDAMGAAVFKKHKYIATVSNIHNGESMKSTMLTELLDRVEKEKALPPPPSDKSKAPAVVSLNTRVLQSAGEIKSAISANARFLLFYYQGSGVKNSGIGTLNRFLKLAQAYKIPNGQWNGGSDGRDPDFLKNKYGNEDPMGVAMFRGGKYLTSLSDICKSGSKLDEFEQVLKGYDTWTVKQTHKEFRAKWLREQAEKAKEAPKKKLFLTEGERANARKKARKEKVKACVTAGQQARKRAKEKVKRSGDCVIL